MMNRCGRDVACVCAIGFSNDASINVAFGQLSGLGGKEHFFKEGIWHVVKYSADMLRCSLEFEQGQVGNYDD